MILTWIEIAAEKPKPGQVALTYTPNRSGPQGVQFEVLTWSGVLAKGGGFGRMKVGKRFVTIEHVEPPPTHYAPLSPEQLFVCAQEDEVMSEYGRMWSHQCSLIEIARQKLKNRPALVTLRDVDEEIVRLTKIRAEMADAEQRMRDGSGQ